METTAKRTSPLQGKDINFLTVDRWARENNQWGIPSQNAEALLSKVKEQVAADPRYNGRGIYKIEYSVTNPEVLIVTFMHGEQANVAAR